MNLLFILYGSLDSNSGYHADIFASKLTALGHKVLVSYAGVPIDTAGLDYAAITHLDLFENTARHVRDLQPDIVHAWTPREIVRMLAEKVRAETADAKLIIHYEDNEEFLAESCIREIISHQSNLGFYDPERGRSFVEAADAFTFVVPTLEEIVPVGGRPFQLLYAPYDDRLFRPSPRNEAWRESHGISAEHLVIVYPGNVHRMNRPDVEMLYRAIELLAESRPVTLVRTGEGIPIETSGPVIDLGKIQRKDMPGVLAAADLMVQPGRPGPFNNYRFPSKLPEMAAIGRPILCDQIPAAELFEDGPAIHKASLDDASTIAAAVELLPPADSDSLPQPGKTVSETLNPAVLAGKLERFGRQLLG